MDQGYEKERFETIKIKTSVAKKFRNYCKSIAKSQSMALRLMVEFFENNGVSPEDHLGETIASIKGQIIKRSNAVIAIIKNVEKTHHKPTTAILQSLFEETANIQHEDEDNFDFGTPKLITENEELIFYRKQYEQMREEHMNLRNEMTKLLNRVNVEKQSFGKNYLKLNQTKNDFDDFRKSNNV